MYKIIADEDDFYVISKDAGTPFHSQNGRPGVVANLREDTGRALYAIHRLDTVTSGLLLLAKSAEAARDLSELFSKHQVEKYYLAFATGKPRKKSGWIIGDMKKSRRGQYKLLRSRINPAVTQFFSYSVRPGLRLYLLRPLTGKTHQIRVMMSSLSTPVIGDTLYGGLAADRAYLHAWHLAFTYKEKHFMFYSPLMYGEYYQLPELAALLSKLSPPGKLSWPVNK